MRHGPIAWFTRRNYAAHRALDPEGLPPTFDEWRALVGQHTGHIRPHMRVVFSPGQFTAWCRAEGREIDASARTAFAEIVATQSRRRAWLRAA
jgi:hypothetical protein